MVIIVGFIATGSDDSTMKVCCVAVKHSSSPLWNKVTRENKRKIRHRSVLSQLQLDRGPARSRSLGMFELDSKIRILDKIISYHYWKRDLCRVQTALPSVKNRALGEELHSAKKGTRQRTSLPSVRLSAKAQHSAQAAPRNGVRPRPSLPSACCQALGKDFFFENTLPTAPDTRRRPPLPSVMSRRSAKFFLFLVSKFFVQPF